MARSTFILINIALVGGASCAIDDRDVGDGAAFSDAGGSLLPGNQPPAESAGPDAAGSRGSTAEDPAPDLERTELSGGTLGSGDVAVGEPCVGAATGCAGVDQLLACIAGQFQEQAVCPGVCRMEAGDALCAGECKPETRGCSAESGPQFCDPEGEWQNDSPCDLATPVCVEGACVLCQPGAARCSEAGIPEVCSDDGLTWQLRESCAAGSLCVPETGQCGQCSPGSVRACVEALGNCAAGQQSCGADATWGPCSIAPAAADSCAPGDDATCDGNPNAGCSCTGDVSCGPELERGICVRGISACLNGVAGACQGAVNPAARDCSSPFDNDCDGTPDDARDGTCECDPGAIEACEQQPGLDGVGICRAGTRRCVAAAGGIASRWGACQGAVAARPRDCRSSLDNDCNGLPDNTLDGTCQCAPGDQRACGEQPGSFGCSQGTQVCQAINGGTQSRWSNCTFTPAANGTTCSDENPLTIGDACQSGQCRGVQTGQVAAGDFSSCAVRAGGAVYCWGDLTVSFGRRDQAIPPTRISLPGPAQMVSVGYLNACAIQVSGVPLCWGVNQAGELGNGTASDFNNIGDAVPSASVAVPVSRLEEGVGQVQVGFFRTIGLDEQGASFIWGLFDAPSGGGIAGQPELFGSTPPMAELHGSLSVVTQPFRIAGIEEATQLALGLHHACALLPGGQVFCWGDNRNGQLGRSTGGASSTPLNVSSVTDATYISAGSSYTCAVRTAIGTVSCWGALVGPRQVDNVQPPTEVPNLRDIIQVSTNNSAACALDKRGSVTCWGRNNAGQLGNGSDTDSLIPEVVMSDVISLANTSPGANHFCALRRNGDVSCWGSNLYGPLGDGTVEDRSTPVTVRGLPN